MTGLIYKEFRQNRLYILLTALIGAVVVFIPLPMIILIEEASVGEALEILAQDEILQLFPLILGFIAAGAFQGSVLRGDERKLWALFIGSSPDGIKGYIRIKYEMIFAMILILTSSLQFFYLLMDAVVFDVTGKVLSDISGIYLILAFAQIFLRAIEIPFIMRFGFKSGSVIKTILLIILTIILSLLIILDPNGIMEKAVDTAVRLFDNFGDGTDIIMLLVQSFPLFAVAAYYISYKISCRVYMKGAERYDK